MSTITGEIIASYLNDHVNVLKYDMIKDGKKFISSAFETIDPSKFDKISTIGAKEYARSAKMSVNVFSLENLLIYFRKWVEINNLKLSEFDEDERIRWVCETKMGKNYNQISAEIFKKVLDQFGFISNVESFSDEDYEIVFLKKGNK